MMKQDRAKKIGPRGQHCPRPDFETFRRAWDSNRWIQQVADQLGMTHADVAYWSYRFRHEGLPLGGKGTVEAFEATRGQAGAPVEAVRNADDARPKQQPPVQPPAVEQHTSPFALLRAQAEQKYREAMAAIDELEAQLRGQG